MRSVDPLSLSRIISTYTVPQKCARAFDKETSVLDSYRLLSCKQCVFCVFVSKRDILCLLYCFPPERATLRSSFLQQSWSKKQHLRNTEASHRSNHQTPRVLRDVHRNGGKIEGGKHRFNSMKKEFVLYCVFVVEIRHLLRPQLRDTAIKKTQVYRWKNVTYGVIFRVKTGLNRD